MTFQFNKIWAWDGFHIFDKWHILKKKDMRQNLVLQIKFNLLIEIKRELKINILLANLLMKKISC